AAANLQSHIIERPHDTLASLELDRQIANGEQARCTCNHVRRRGSRMSRSPSPNRLQQNTEKTSAAPGKNTTHHSPDSIEDAPSATMMPHSGAGGLTPRPMKERPAAFRIAQPRLS